MNRGFTIVELIVVLIVLSILVGLSIAGVQGRLNSGYDSQRKAIAAAASASLERYYKTNNEYPSASELGGTPTATPPSNYSLASSKLGMSASAFTADSFVFVPCNAGPYCSKGYLNKDYIYYATRYNQTDTGTTYGVTVPVGTTAAECMYSMPTADVGSLVYLLMFWSDENEAWQVAKSNNGTVTMQRRPNSSGSWTTADSSATGCPFIML